MHLSFSNNLLSIRKVGQPGFEPPDRLVMSPLMPRHFPAAVIYRAFLHASDPQMVHGET